MLKVHYPVGLLDEEFILDIFSEDKEKAIRQFMEFNGTNNGDVCLEEKAGTRLTDEAARDEILSRKQQNRPFASKEFNEIPRELNEYIIQIKISN